MVNRGHALSRDELIRTLTAYNGVTTADGAADGTTLIDSTLINNPYISPSGIPGKSILIMSGNARGEDKGAASFNNTNGTVTLGSAFSAQIMAGTSYRLLNISSVETLIGTPPDNADLATLFGRLRREYLGTHTHALLVVHDASALDADLDTALRAWLLDIGLVVTVCDPADVAANLEVSSFDLIVVSASCVAGDAGNLANLRTAEAPVLCHSAAIAVSTVFNMGTTAATKAAQTQIEITDNSAMWLIDQALANLTVTASATIYTIATAGTNVVEFGQEANGTNLLTLLKLPQGEQDDGTPTYSPFFDRYFIGVGDFTNMNTAFKSILEELVMHTIMEKRFAEGLVSVKRVYEEQIPDTGFSLAAVDTTLTNDPPSADAANSVVDIDAQVNRTFVLRSLWVNITNLGGGTATMTFKLWVDIGGTPTEVDSVDVTVTGYRNLMDIFGLLEVHADSIYITAQVNAGTGACAGIYRYAEAKK